MKIRYDPEVDALYIELTEAPIQESDEVTPGFIVDYDADGKPVAIELLDASDFLGGKRLSIELSVADRSG